MTTILTEEDFIRAMDSNPAFLEAARSRLLTREILELPATVQRLTETLELFIESTNRRLAALESGQTQIIGRLDTLESNQTKMIGRLDSLESNQTKIFGRLDTLESNQTQIIGRLDGLTTDVDTLKEDVGTLKENVGTLNENVGTLITRVDSLAADVGDIRGVHARDAAIRRATLIPRRMGFRLKRILSLDDIVEIVDGADTTGISRDTLISFEEADLIMLATDAEGAECYVPVEVSYTIYPKDTERAIRNAGFLTDWTGLPAYPGVAGIRVNWRSESTVESGEVFFYRIPQEALKAN